MQNAQPARVPPRDRATPSDADGVCGNLTRLKRRAERAEAAPRAA